MDRKSKILLYISFFLFVGTVMFAYARYMVFRDFEVMWSEEITSEESAEEAVPEGQGEEQESADSSVEDPAL